jgi:hypothetical protein
VDPVLAGLAPEEEAAVDKVAKHTEWTRPDAGESHKDIVSKNKPLSKALRDKLDDPDLTPERHAPGKEPGMGHPSVPSFSGEAYKDLTTKNAYAQESKMIEDYTQGFMDKCASFGVEPEELVKSAQQGFAGRALQSPLGQKALGFAGGAYQQLPQGVRGRVSNWASNRAVQAGSDSPLMNAGANVDPDVAISSDTTVKNDEVVDDTVNQHQKGTAGGYGAQFNHALSQGGLPVSTFKPGTPVNVHTKIQNDEVKGHTMLPRGNKNILK